MRNPKRMPLLKKGVLIHATQRTWQEWVQVVINNPAIIIGDDTGNKNPDNTKNKAGRKERKSDRKAPKAREIKGPASPPILQMASKQPSMWRPTTPRTAQPMR